MQSLRVEYTLREISLRHSQIDCGGKTFGFMANILFQGCSSQVPCFPFGGWLFCVHITLRLTDMEVESPHIRETGCKYMYVQISIGMRI